MSNELKCPCCNSILVVNQEGKNIPIPECPNCLFRCGFQYYEQLSAAMKLVRAMVAKNKLSKEEKFKGPITAKRLEQYKQLNISIDSAFAEAKEIFCSE